MENEVIKKDDANTAEIKVISDGISLDSIKLMYTCCTKTQNNRPTTK